MEKVLTAVTDLEFYLMEGFWAASGDPRVGRFFFMTSFRLPLALLVLYLLSVYLLAPLLVRGRHHLHPHNTPRKCEPPKWHLHLYNLSMTAFSGYIVYHNVLHYQTLLRAILDVHPPSNYLDTSAGTTGLLQQLYLFLLSRYAHLLKPVLAILRRRPVSNSAIYGAFSMACFGWMHYRCAGSVLPLLAAAGALLPLYDCAHHCYALLADLRPELQFNFSLKVLLMKMQLVAWFLLALHLLYYALMLAVYCLQVASVANLMLYGGNVAVYLTLFAYDFFMPNL
ncbi:hypothetical protein TYRP_013326 [Tyrophagus putrescentiae]|nr:hypothetical protein TYRP_013326 [Tyrophagus putrescentiae]